MRKIGFLFTAVLYPQAAFAAQHHHLHPIAAGCFTIAIILALLLLIWKIGKKK